MIEASYLFDVGEDRIEVLENSPVGGPFPCGVRGRLDFWPSSGRRTCALACALAWPDRLPWPAPRLDLAAIGSQTFENPDEERFPALRVARAALRAGGNAPAGFNAAMPQRSPFRFLDRRLRAFSIRRRGRRNARKGRGDPSTSPPPAATRSRARSTPDRLARRTAEDAIRGLASAA